MKPPNAFQSPKLQNPLACESVFFNLFREDVSRCLSVTFPHFPRLPAPCSVLPAP